MKKHILILMISAMFVSCSVDEFLDVKPTGTLIPETVEHFDKLLEDFRASSQAWINLTYMDPDTYLLQKGFDGLFDEQWKRQYQWSQKPYTEEDDDEDWINRYRQIYIYNQIISDIGSAELGNRLEADRTRVLGEAYAGRAMELFLLVNEYAPHISSTTLGAPAIPMPLVIDLTAQLPRSTVDQVYDQLLSDLAIAENLLQNAPNYNSEANFRPGKAAIKALYAIVNLYAGNFEEAKTFSNEALNLYDFVYDFTEFTNETIGNAWTGLAMDGDNFLDFDQSTNAKSVLWNRTHRYFYSDPEQLYHPDLAALFDKDNDQRWILFSSDEDFNGTDLSPNFAYARIKAETQSGITVPNLILVNAEAKARTGDNQGALDALNSLLVKRILNFTPLTVVNTPDVLQKVKDERRKELMATGMNLIDLKRYHAYGESIPTFTRDINGQTFTLSPGSQEYVAPISAKIRLLNPNL